MSSRKTPAICPRTFLLLLLLFDAGQLGVEAHPLLVFLIDGFRYDYMDDLHDLPGFRELVENGVKVDHLTPDFPSLSYPNYYSLMTGRHCDIHQMTGNYMWDEVSKKEFLIGTNPDSRLPIWWDGSEPLWVTLQKLGRKVFMYYWPDLTASITNALTVLRSNQADMAAIYYEKIDVEGHHFGPDSRQVKTAVQQLDLAMQKLNSKIKEMNMVNQLNIMLFSDHGMTKLHWMEKVIELDKYINMADIVKMMDRGPVVSLWPEENKFQEIDMRGFFLATGPDFKMNVRAAPIRSVDVYNLMCWTLGVDPLPNNGSWSRVECLLSSSDGVFHPFWIYCVGLLAIILTT
ncbi:glycerophosphocholine cholinephosphodiesterase ENPP6 [Neolamprologus brichardi]|uniref:glycerophosphocholine cholinephosphodiesterase ENPP6 n=1 Tax=Neolamprologus brichardi TaxID=32507 RepID=UPI0003EC2405|nr:glycerophosphocholine cholinephosphodiesterase ENPP6 [Neolamprologus brichardi]